MYNQQITKRLTIAFVIIVSIFTKVSAQVPPAGKYDTSNYPQDRKLIMAIQNNFDSSLSLNDNYVGVGAGGRIVYGKAAHLKGFQQLGWSFKSFKPVVGISLIRIFNGNTAIKTDMVDVIFSSLKGDLSYKVIRTDTFIKQDGKWFYVMGQGTNYQTDEEMAEDMNRHLVK
ncbi:MAG: hypothetical protein ABJA37_07615 [Ferruginibacter sp.]